MKFALKYYAILVFASLMLFSCQNKESKAPVEEVCPLKKAPMRSEFDGNDTLPGRKVVETYQNDNPKIVYFYKTDELGNPTEEKTREVYYFEGQKRYMEGDIHQERRNGKWYSYFKNGYVNSEATYIDGKEDGEYTVYYENGNPLYIGYYDKGVCTGTWVFYDESGHITKTITADENTPICRSCSRCKAIFEKQKESK